MMLHQCDIQPHINSRYTTSCKLLDSGSFISCPVTHCLVELTLIWRLKSCLNHGEVKRRFDVDSGPFPNLYQLLGLFLRRVFSLL